MSSPALRYGRAVALGWISATLFACGTSAGAPSDLAPPDGFDTNIRRRLRIPDDAKHVVVFGQNAHMDIDWQKTLDGYYKAYVGDILTEARQILDAQDRAYYSVAEMGFLQRHVETHPEEIAPLKQHAARGALRIVGGGMTSPDSLLPETELFLRDYLHGARFSEDTLGARAKVAWLPDSFGHAATVPDLLSAVGIEAVAMARIDGSADVFENLFGKNHGPKPGSTAEQLQRLGSADFVWKGPGGGQIIAHYLAGVALYCQGDNIDYDEKLTTPGTHLGVYDGDQPDYVDRMIQGYVDELLPYSKTPYMFVPVGCDFQHPKAELISYLDGWNERQYAATGTWAVAAPFEDYIDLIRPLEDQLPQIEADLTPYFMGYYASRVDVKKRIREAARPYFAAESFSTELTDVGTQVAAQLAPSFAELTLSNHHDFISGTSTDAVVMSEQLPLLDKLEAAGQQGFASVAAALARRIPPTAGAVARVIAFNSSTVTRSDVEEVTLRFTPPLPDLNLTAQVGSKPVSVEVVDVSPGQTSYASARLRFALADMPPVSMRAIDLFHKAAPLTPAVMLQLLDENGQSATGAAVKRVILSNEHVTARFDGSPQGFALTSLMLDGVESLAGPSFLLRDYHDQGGLYRIGSEMEGCTFTLDPSSTSLLAGETIEIVESTNLRAHIGFRSTAALREATVDAGATGLALALTTGAAMATTRTTALALSPGAAMPMRTSYAGGYAERTAQKIFTPTFWPAVGWATTGPLSVLLRQSTGVQFGSDGSIEIMVARDARSEACSNEGGTGTDTAIHHIEWRLERAAGPVQAEGASQAWNRPVILYAPSADQDPAPDLAAEMSLLRAEGQGVVTALKPADRGQGVILRALLLPGPLVVHPSAALIGKKLTRVDAAERDLEELGLVADPITLDASRFGRIATVRMH